MVIRLVASLDGIPVSAVRRDAPVHGSSAGCHRTPPVAAVGGRHDDPQLLQSGCTRVEEVVTRLDPAKAPGRDL
jgi:hypothetical protein